MPTFPEALGWLRGGVGVAMIVAPRTILEVGGRTDHSGPSILLLRTIGIRDLVLGLGALSAARGGDRVEMDRWSSATMASDALDVVASVAAVKALGRRDALGAAGLAAVFVGLGAWARRRSAAA